MFGIYQEKLLIKIHSNQKQNRILKEFNNTTLNKDLR